MKDLFASWPRQALSGESRAKLMYVLIQSLRPELAFLKQGRQAFAYTCRPAVRYARHSKAGDKEAKIRFNQRFLKYRSLAGGVASRILFA